MRAFIFIVVTLALVSGPTAVAATAAVTGQRIAAGTTVTTGTRSRAVIRFDDGQAIVLNENSEFRVTEYSFVREQPAKDSFKFELVKGALRSVTAGLTRRTPRVTCGTGACGSPPFRTSRSWPPASTT